MNSQLRNRCFSALLALLFFSPIWAQNVPTDQLVGNWFLEERFIIADQNDDALLEREEMETFSNEFEYYLTDRNYTITDRNRDGFLSYNELLARTRSEYMYRYNMEQRKIRMLTAQYPTLNNPSIGQLKAQPNIVEQLFTNLSWMYKNESIVNDIYADKAWMDAHPRVKLALHKNLRWMAANPSKARDLYRDRDATQQLPELLGWRADHKNFFRKYPKLDRFYLLEFFPSEIRINR